MRELSFNEINEVNGASANFTFFRDKTLGYGATGVLANMVLNGVSMAIGWQGFLIGAGVGAGLAAVTILANELHLN